MKSIAIIPARLKATRFPNKPLALISGIPMIGHVYKRTMLSNCFDHVVVATEDEEIKAYIELLGGVAVMTSDTHERCTDRTAEALQKEEGRLNRQFDVIGMVQGDEPLVSGSTLRSALEKFRTNNESRIINVMGRIRSVEEFHSPNTVKVAVNGRSQAVYFSREPIPSAKKFNEEYPKYKQTGLIFFKRDLLIQFNSMEATPLEKIESVDMLRLLENNIDIQMLLTEETCLGVDIPNDVLLVERELESDQSYLCYRDELRSFNV